MPEEETSRRPGFGDPQDLQGNSLLAFAKPWQTVIALAAPDGEKLRSWLRLVLPAVTSQHQVGNYRALRRAAPTAVPQTVWLHLSLSSHGLRSLAVPTREWGSGFDEGMLARIPLFAGQAWQNFVGLDHASAVLAILGADSEPQIEAATRGLVRSARRFQLSVLSLRSGNRLVGDVDHFGNRDGISQPDLSFPQASGPASEVLADPRASRSIEPFIVADSADPELGAPPWMDRLNGTFLVYVRFLQDVETFARFTSTVSAQVRAVSPALRFVTADLIGAKLLGRWPSGAPISKSPQHDDPTLAEDNEFDFATDGDGVVCPLAAHISKSFPRRRPVAEPAIDLADHRILRRGIPFGLRHPAAGERGLLFFCYQASIETQFEHLLRRWANAADFPREGAGVDPLIGRMGSSDRPFPFAVETPDGTRFAFTVDVPTLVLPTEGGYFFSPSVSALRRLAADSARPQGE